VATRKSNHKSGRRWVAKVTTDSTHPRKGLFKKDAATIARSLASKRVSPKGPQSGLRMLNYFINRGGKGLSPTRRRVLERAKSIMMRRLGRGKSPRAKS
jgi:tRNA(adenine34) deaminase